MQSQDWYELIRRITQSQTTDWEKLEAELTTWLANKDKRGIADAFAEHALALGFERASLALALA